jgi:hypothetical protein
VLGAVGIHVHLVKVLLVSSLGLGLFSIEVRTDLDKGILDDPSLLFPHDKGLLPLSQLLLPMRGAALAAPPLPPSPPRLRKEGRACTYQKAMFGITSESKSNNRH